MLGWGIVAAVAGEPAFQELDAAAPKPVSVHTLQEGEGMLLVPLDMDPHLARFPLYTKENLGVSLIPGETARVLIVTPSTFALVPTEPGLTIEISYDPSTQAPLPLINTEQNALIVPYEAGGADFYQLSDGMYFLPPTLTRNGAPWTGSWQAHTAGEGPVAILATDATGAFLGTWRAGQSEVALAPLPYEPSVVLADREGIYLYSSEQPCIFVQQGDRPARCPDADLGAGDRFWWNSQWNGAIVTKGAATWWYDLERRTREPIPACESGTKGGDLTLLNCPGELRVKDPQAWWSIPVKNPKSTNIADRPAAMSVGVNAAGQQRWLTFAPVREWVGHALFPGGSGFGLPTTTYGIDGNLLTRVDLVAGTEVPVAVVNCASEKWFVSVYESTQGVWHALKCDGGSTYLLPPFGGALATTRRIEGVVGANHVIVSERPEEFGPTTAVYAVPVTP